MTETLWAVLVGGVLTLAGGAVAEIIRSRSASSREQEARTAAKQDRLDEIQRDTLLQLQERLNHWLRAETEAFMADDKALKTTGKLFQLPDGVSDAAFETSRLGRAPWSGVN